MAKQHEALFEESSQGAVSAVTAVMFVLSAVLLFGGMVLSSYGFTGEDPDLTVFSLGLVAILVGFFIPFAALPASGK